MSNKDDIASIPLRWVGPIKVISKEISDTVQVPLATFETPLFASVARGAKISRLTAGINAVITQDCMTRSIVLQAKTATDANEIAQTLRDNKQLLSDVTSSTSRFAKLQDWHTQIVGNLLYLRFRFYTDKASGHNMATKAAQAILQWILKEHAVAYISLSGNICSDKKVSAINGILGRGKHVVAEMIISQEICEKHLRCTPSKLVALHQKKNLLGSIIAGAVHSANAHVANMLLAFYLATGQDAANIVEGSQAIVHTEVIDNDLYFSVTLPNIIVGTIGNGKNLEFATNNLNKLGCNSTEENSSRKLAILISCCVLCGELSLLAALSSPNELMRAHEILERRNSSNSKL